MLQIIINTNKRARLQTQVHVSLVYMCVDQNPYHAICVKCFRGLEHSQGILHGIA
jgi:hypothetical protein